jgi:DNA-binding NarL/FixJ family response regulator
MFKSVLIVEDLDEPRQWMEELVLKELSGVEAVHCAASLSEAYEHMAAHQFQLALVDWTLPDGVAEDFIRVLSQRQPQALVVVATIHDDDAHVFPALRAGARGYLLKSQPRDEVAQQLKRMELGEPPLSPSIAWRILQSFNASTTASAPVKSAVTTAIQLAPREIDVLRLIAKGYTNAEVATMLKMTRTTVTSYVRDIYYKLEVSSRAEATLEAMHRGLIA